jgi:CBS domain-containing protein
MKSALDLMMKNVVAVTPETPVLDAIKVMQDAHIGAILVAAAGNLEGIFTERDLIKKFFDIVDSENMETIKMRDVMTRNLITVSPDQPYADCLKYMQVKSVRHLPVVENGRILGILSIRDLLEQVISDYKNHVELQ